MVTDAEPAPVHETVTTTCVAPALTVNEFVPAEPTVTVNVTVCVIAGETHVAVTTTENVPLVVARVETESVAELGNELIGDGEAVQAPPGGQPMLRQA